MMKKNKTKIVATLGPASCEEATIEELVLSGATMFRINTSHNTAEAHAETIKRIRNVEKKLKTWLDQPEVAPWFSPDTQIINETEILQQKGTFLRPDRVVISGEEVSVIDYKFGNIQKKSYHKQVIRYISLIKEMGFSQVKGYIWYVELGKIVPV